ncbi:MAG: protein kinase [Lysobacteraceae bacterium]
MDADELRRWREADRLFAQWLALTDAQRISWRDELAIDRDVAALLQRMIDRQQQDESQDRPLPPLPMGDAGDDAGSDSHNRLAGRQVGNWTLVEELGRGGMSVVYRARRELNGGEQEAAVKLLTLGSLGTQGHRRFEQEARVLASLRHPHIAALIDSGIADDGTPFLAMTLVEGETLAEHCRRHVPDWQGRVRLLRRVCDAVAHAHRNLLVHRDIKPGNVVVTDEGLPVLLDFGIAKLLDERQEHTAIGLRALTPGYAAPEQVDGGAITTATDVFALGVVLKTLCDDLQPLPADLRNIIHRASHADPERRYADARALGEDLDNLLRQRRVRATPDSLGYRLRVLLRRRRAAVLATLLVALSLLTGLGLALWQAGRAAREADEARHQSVRAEAARDFLFSLIRAGDREASDNPDLPVSEVIARGVASLRDSPPDDAELHAEMAMMLGQLQTGLGNYASAGELLAEAAAAAEQVNDDVLRVRVLTRRGTLANAEGDPAAALTHFDAALAALPQVASSKRGNLLEGIASGWAYAMQSSGREAEAHARLQKELDALRAQTGKAPSASLLRALAMTSSDPEQQLAILLRLKDVHAKEPTQPTEQLALAANLGSIYGKLGQPQEALTWSQEAARLADRIHPGATSRRARVYSNLASAARSAGQLKIAAQALATAESIYRELGDDQSPAFAALMNNRGINLLDAGNAEEALSRLETALALAQRYFGDDDSRSLGVERSVVTALLESGRLDEADARWTALLARTPQDVQAAVRHAQLMTGAALAAAHADADLLRSRLSAARALATQEGGLLQSPENQLRGRSLDGMAASLAGDDAAAVQAFSDTEAQASINPLTTRAARWRNQLAWAEHLDRQGNPDAARPHYATALELLDAAGLDPQSALYRRLKASVAASD